MGMKQQVDIRGLDTAHLVGRRNGPVSPSVSWGARSEG